MDYKKLYCKKCGKELVDTFVFSHYHRGTGEKIYKIHSKCFAKKWYNTHDHFMRTFNDYGTVYYQTIAEWELPVNAKVE
jgi:hypothetical protein